MNEEKPFLEFLRERIERGGFTTEDGLAAVLPLFRETLAAHEGGKVAPLDGVDQISAAGNSIFFPRSALADLHWSRPRPGLGF